MAPAHTTHVDIFVDGSSRGNPGPSAIGIVIFAKGDSTTPLYEYSCHIGVATNNIAEYEALIHALKWIKHEAPDEVTIHMDSELVYKQVMGRYRVKNPRMKVQLTRVQRLCEQCGPVIFQLIPRENNKHANRLAQKASQQHKSPKQKFTQEPLL
jgi:probable phosphoglycerate mutase